MLLTISTEYQPATDLGFLLHKHPERFQTFQLSFGCAHVFYPEVSPQRTTVALLLDVDAVGMIRSRKRDQRVDLQYVNDRPYVASSLLSVAISQVFGAAMAGRSSARPELAAAKIPLEASIDVLPVRGTEDLLRRLFEPLGYSVTTSRHALDECFPEWGPSPYYSLQISATLRLSELLSHLYVLVPVFDNDKHYYVGEDEVEKLLAKGQGWLATHPEKEQVARRYLKHRTSLYRSAIARLSEDGPAAQDDQPSITPAEEALEQPLSLNQQRHAAVVEALRASGAQTVLDLGCGDGKLLRSLLAERQFQQIVGLDVSMRSLEIAERRLKLDQIPERQAARTRLIQGSLIYRDSRIVNFDAAAIVEVIEHLDPPRLSALERVLFEHARSKTVVLTTPNREYNVMWPALPAGHFRHPDHRFEWTRREFSDWCTSIAARFGYASEILPIGPVNETVGAPTQMCVFRRSQ